MKNKAFSTKVTFTMPVNENTVLSSYLLLSQNRSNLETLVYNGNHVSDSNFGFGFQQSVFK